MCVPVVNIRVMRVAVLHRDVRMQVAVTFATIQWRFVRVLVVLIMAVFMFMLQPLMQVFMGMVLREVQPHA